jgi:diguanylate cyclase (GGDEF)-like protein
LVRRFLIVGCAVALALTALTAVTPLGGSRGDDLVGNWLHGFLMTVAALVVVARAVRVREDRAAWLCFSVALVTYAAGEIVWNAAYAGRESPPYPSVADGLWLAFYPATYTGIALLARARLRDYGGAGLWLDGLLGALVFGALGSALIFEPVLHTTEGSTGAVATTLAYPLGDLVLLGLLLEVFALTRWRPDRVWLLIAAGLATNCVADILYSYQSAQGTWVDGSLADGLFPLAVLLVAGAAWQPPTRRELEGGEWRIVAVPAGFIAVGIGVLAYGLFFGVNPLAATLAVGAALVVLIRFGVIFHENLRMLRRSRHEALTDALTGLPNRRALVADLDTVVADATASDPRALALFDLDGFKRYNDTFGHPAGDALLEHLGGRLERATEGRAMAYRLGGDEFCVLCKGRGAGLETVVAAASEALTDRGEGFAIDSSSGIVVIPDEARTAREALILADQRMYARKGARPFGARSQASQVLMRVLHEREPELHEHQRGVAALARQVGRRLGMGADALDELTRAAELHDIGKMAIPDEVLSKAGELDEDGWAFMTRHTIIGERILGAAEALRPIARIVRASHERWDGEGYPDRLADEDIPLAARIVFACDAYDAMISERPYAHARPPDEALAEVRRCAGSQFDPRVVQALCEVIDRSAPPVTAAEPVAVGP